MRHYLVRWTNFNEEYRDLIVYANDEAHAKALVRASYKYAHKIKTRWLQ